MRGAVIGILALLLPLSASALESIHEPLLLPIPQRQTPAWMDLLAAEPMARLLDLEDPNGSGLFDGRAYPAWGPNSGLVRSRNGAWFRVHASRGFQGQVEPPAGAHWLAIDPRDHVVAAVADGRLLVARVDGAGRIAASDFEELARVPGAVAWDIGPNHLAAVTETQVFFRRHGEKAFRDARWPTGNGLLARVFVRSDGLLVVQSAGQPARTFVASMASRRWSEAEHHPARLRRHGDWIWNGDLDAPRVLASDGQTWTSAVDPRSWMRLGYGDLMGLSPFPDGRFGRPMITLSEPAAPTPPPPGRQHTGSTAGGPGSAGEPVPQGASDPGAAPLQTPRQALDLDALRRDRDGRAQRLAAQLTDCEGAGCVSPLGPTETLARYRFGFLTDGRCATPPGGPAWGACYGLLDRAAHAVLIDELERRIDVVDLPDACEPLRLEAHGGLGFLMCREADSSRVSVYSARAGDPWLHEGTLPLAAARAPQTMLADGSLVVHGLWCRGGAEGPTSESEPCVARAWIRDPYPPGGGALWREARGTQGIGLRQVGDGGLLWLSAAPNDPQVLSLHLEQPGSVFETLVEDVPIEGRLEDLALTPEGCVVLQFEDGEQFLMGKQGTLIRGSSCTEALAARREAFEVDLACKTDGTRVVLVDTYGGSESFDCKDEIAVQPGRYLAMAWSTDRQVWRRTIQGTAGERRRYTVRLPRNPVVAINALGGGFPAPTWGSSFRLDASYHWILTTPKPGRSEQAVDLGAALRLAPSALGTAVLVMAGAHLVFLGQRSRITVGPSIGYGRIDLRPVGGTLDDRRMEARVHLILDMRFGFRITPNVGLQAGLGMLTAARVLDLGVGIFVML
jgi:hypothetical protein